MCREPLMCELRADLWVTWLPVQVRERSELGEFASLEHAAEAEAGAGARSQVAQLLAADALRAEQLSAAQAELAAARAALEARDSQASATILPLSEPMPDKKERPACSLMPPWHAICTPILCGAPRRLPWRSVEEQTLRARTFCCCPCCCPDGAMEAMEPAMPYVSAWASWHK